MGKLIPFGKSKQKQQSQSLEQQSPSQDSSSQERDKTVNTEMIANIVQAIEHRTPILKKLPKHLRYNFLVEKRNVLDSWDEFYKSFWPAIKDLTDKEITITADQFYKSVWFAYFFGSFYKHNGEEEKDEKFVMGCYIFLNKTIGFVDGEEFDFEKMYFNAFPC